MSLLTPVPSVNLLAKLLPEQRAWRKFAGLRRQIQMPGVRVLHEFRVRTGVTCSDHYSRLDDRLQPIPTGLRLPAQGCEEGPTLGNGGKQHQPQQGCGFRCDFCAAIPLGLGSSHLGFPG
jgi:hypothetical protein